MKKFPKLFSFSLSGFYLLISAAATINAQGIRGTITDETGNSVPGVSIYIKETSSGTTSNDEGNYEFNLENGNYYIIFQALGFGRQELQVKISGHWVTQNIVLLPIQYNLREIKIYSGEDPAYGIMRKAIARAPYHLRQAKKYEAEVYLKGSLRMKKIPKLIQKNFEINNQKVKPGETYTSESVNIIKFTAPDSFMHTVKASRSTFPGKEESSMMGYINSSFYDSRDGMIISPLSKNALKHYNFRYEGFFDDGKVTVNKIKVIPKRKSQQLVEGDLFIVENLWNIHSLDFTFSPFWGKLRIRQIYSPVKNNVWLPVSHHFDVDASFLGVKADFDYAGSVKYLSLILNYGQNENRDAVNSQNQKNIQNEIIKKQEVPLTPKKQKQMDELLSKEELTNKDMMKLATLIEESNKKPADNIELELKNTYRFNIKKDSIKRDTLFWNNIRPIPLTTNEKTSFAKRDSLLALNSVADSTNTPKPGKKSGSIIGKILTGTTIPADTAKVRLTYGGLISLKHLGFNPVDGWKYAQDAEIIWKQDSINSMRLAMLAGYAFSAKKPYGRIVLTQTYLPGKRGLLSVSGFFGTNDYKKDLAMSGLVSMASSLLFKQNYQRFYYTQNINITNGFDLANGLRVEISNSYHNYEPLNNNTNFSLVKKNKEYAANNIYNIQTDESNLKKQDALIMKLNVDYTPRHYYYMRKGRKIMSHSDFPTFTAKLEQGIKAFSTNADYTLAEIGAFKKNRFSFGPNFDWNFNAGWFIRSNQIHFSNFKHFSSSTIPVIIGDTNNHMFLTDDYFPSTNEWFIKAGATYSSPFLLIKNLPFFSNRLWNENLHLGYLHTPLVRNYIQTGYSISRIFMTGSIGVYAGFADGKYHDWGIRIALSKF